LSIVFRNSLNVCDLARDKAAAIHLRQVIAR
jgi:hypothetical protein